MNLHGSRAFIDWILDTLTGGGLWAELGRKPPSVPAATGWAVVYPIAGGIVTGTLDEPLEDATPHVQVTSVGLAADQALWVADRARVLLMEAVPADLSDGRKVIFGAPVFAETQLLRDDDVQPPVYSAIDRFEFRTAAGVLEEAS